MVQKDAISSRELPREGFRTAFLAGTLRCQALGANLVQHPSSSFITQRLQVHKTSVLGFKVLAIIVQIWGKYIVTRYLDP